MEDLAKEVGVSRTVLGGRFADFIGEPPMQYLKRWRLARAKRSAATEPLKA